MLRQHELEAQVKQLEQQLQGLQLQLAKQQRAAAAQGAPGSAGGSAEGSPQPGALLQQASEDELGAAGGGGAAAAAAAADERAAELARELATVRQELVVQRDRADEFERLLRQQMEAAAAAQAAAAAAAAAQAAAAQAAEAAADTAAEQGEAPGSAAGAPARLSAGAAATPGAYAAASPLLALAGGAPALAGTPLTGGRPSAAFLAASPLLAASRGVAEWMTDAAAAEAATPAGETLPLLRLLPSAEALCCQEESHMAPEELRALQARCGCPAALLHCCRLPCCCRRALAWSLCLSDFDLKWCHPLAPPSPACTAGQGGAAAGRRRGGRRPGAGPCVWRGAAASCGARCPFLACLTRPRHAVPCFVSPSGLALPCDGSPPSLQAALYALLAYNKCLGQAITAAEDAEEDRLAQEQQQAALFQQLFDEKAMCEWAGQRGAAPAAHFTSLTRFHASTDQMLSSCCCSSPQT